MDAGGSGSEKSYSNRDAWGSEAGNVEGMETYEKMLQIEKKENVP